MLRQSPTSAMPSFSVHKSVVIRSDPETVYAMLRDFKRWPSWSPWLVTEPDCPLKFSPDVSSYEWDGRFVGSGRATISGESAPEHISIQLAFQRPWKSNAEVEFLLSTDLEGTRVTWTMKSAVPWFLFFMRSMMEALIGMDYDRGLSMLKDRLETGNVPSRLEFVGVQDSPAVRYVVSVLRRPWWRAGGELLS